jgi:hypothetical protein
MKYRRPLILVGSLFLFLVLILGALVALLDSPASINKIAAVLEKPLGYRVRIQGISFSKVLKAEIRGLEIRDVRKGAFSLFAAQLVAEGRVTDAIRGEVESLTLTGPKFYFRLRGGKKETDFSALEKLPPVRKLTVRGGEFSLSSDAFDARVSDLNADIANFSPRSGGRTRFHGRLQISTLGEEGVEATGACSGEASLTALFPRPAGKGSVEVRVDSAALPDGSLKNLLMKTAFTLDGKRMAFPEVRTTVGPFTHRFSGRTLSVQSALFLAAGAYDPDSATVTVDAFTGEVPGLGTLKGSFKGILKDDIPWNAALTMKTLDFRNIFSLMKPLLSAEYATWEVEGKGDAEAQIQGHWRDALDLTGTCTLHFTEGGFTSADQSRAAQKLTGSVVLKLRSPEGKAPSRFDLSLRTGDGEFLWGKYYRDFKGEEVSLSADGTYSAREPLQIDYAGRADLRELSPLQFSGTMKGQDYTLSLHAEQLSHRRLCDILLADYLKEANQLLYSLTTEGESSLAAVITHSGDRTRIEGSLAVRATSLAIPSIDLSVRGVSADVPFSFALPRAIGLPAVEPPAGAITVDRLQKGDLALENMRIPLRLWGNRLEVLEEVVIPIMEGRISLSHFEGRDLLSPSRLFDLSLSIDDVDLAAVTHDPSGISFEGKVDADFPSIRFKEGRWTAEGQAKVQVFGGHIEMANLYAVDPFFSSRSFGGDITFSAINLEEVTKKIKVGRMTGVIRGSLRGFKMEYGQPAAFVLDLETDPGAKTSRAISVDAIENLSIIGTGSAAVGMVLHSGLNRFFKEYPYSRIGILCTLENDVFSLRGKIHEGGKEFLIRKALFRGIDVVNQSPNNSISFKDMEERIGRIFRPREDSKNVS